MVALSTTLFATSVLAGLARAVNPVVIQGQEFVDTVTKNRVQIIGVDYEPGGQASYNDNIVADALSNGTVCLRDAALLQMLGVNTIRVYNVNPAANHDQCASIFNEAGIYMILDVNSPNESLNRDAPWTSYTLDYLTRIFGVVEAFKGYPNTMGFFSANEVMNDVSTGGINPPYIRAVQRDLKAYIAKQSSRTIPVGYSAADVRPILQDTWNYLQCTGNSSLQSSTSDFFGLNSYSWCGASATYTSSGYDQLVALFQNSSIPVFFSEYGCNQPAGVPRVFNEVAALYGTDMTSLSGGLVYEYSEETSDYGLVVINDDSSVKLRQDYNNLQSQYNKLNISLLEDTEATNSKTTPPQCSPGLITTPGFSTNFDLPAQPAGAAALISNGIANPNQGQIVSVGSLDVNIPVYDVNGNQLSGVKVVARTDANTPNGQTASGVATSTSASATSTSTPTPTKQSSAMRIQIPWQMSLVAWVVGVWLI